jgi:hypothetical protein
LLTETSDGDEEAGTVIYFAPLQTGTVRVQVVGVVGKIGLGVAMSDFQPDSHRCIHLSSEYAAP